MARMFVSGRTRSKTSLAERISALSNPKPVSFHPDQEFLEDETAAKLCDFTYEEDPSDIGSQTRKIGTRIREAVTNLEEDPKYAGKVVSRKDLEAGSEGKGRGFD